MQSIEHKILTNVTKRGRGKIIFPQDFASYGTPEAVRQALSRLAASKKIIRISHGIYCYPKTDKVLGLDVLYPTFEEIAAAIARRDNAKIVPTGVFALNKLGLSTQLPMNVVYLTDGSPRKIKLQGNRGVQFKHTAKKNLAYTNEFVMLLTFALREIGQNNITSDELARIHELIKSYPKEIFMRDWSLIPAWIRKIITISYE